MRRLKSEKYVKEARIYLTNDQPRKKHSIAIMSLPASKRKHLLLLFCITHLFCTRLEVSSYSPSAAGSLASKKRANNRPPEIVACSSPTEVQRAINLFIQPKDCVLEIGAQLSDTTSQLCRKIGADGEAVLIDVKRKDATSGRSCMRNTTPFIASSADSEKTKDDIQNNNDQGESFIDRATYVELDQFDQWRSLTKEKTYNAMILDVGTMIGNDLYLTSLSIANEFIANQNTPPRIIIIKSKTLSTLARRIVHSQRLLDGSKVLPGDLKRTQDPIIVPCVGVNEYRRTIPLLVNAGDDVVEVGCHFGRSTTLLYNAVHDTAGNGIQNDESDGFCVGVDIGPKIIANAKKQNPHIPFKVVDAWNTLDLLKVKLDNGRTSSLGYDIVYADIGGLSGAHGLLESLALMDAIAKALEPRCIVIKSLCMNRLASQLVAFSNIWNKINPNNEVLNEEHDHV